jgi:hypothetical protein
MYKKKLPLCTLGYAERKIPSGENQKPLPDASSCRICNSAVMNISICNAQLHLTEYVENICCFFALQMLILSAAELQIRQDEGQGTGFAPALQAGAKPVLFLIHATQNTACAERETGCDVFRRLRFAYLRL